MSAIITGYIVFFTGVFCAIAFFRFAGLYDDLLRQETLLKFFTVAHVAILFSPSTVGFWLISVFVLYFTIRKSKSELAVVSAFIFLIIILPGFGKDIQMPGVGFLGRFTFAKMAALLFLLLLPLGIFKPRTFNEKLLLFFVILVGIGGSREGNPVTGFIREGIHAFLEVYVPYIAIVRLVDNFHKIKVTISVFLFATVAHIVPAMYEFVRQWNPYNLYYFYLGEPAPLLFKRFRSGFLRTSNVFANPIIFGYCSAMAFIYGVYFLQFVKKGRKLIFIAVTIFCSIIAFSKGPYLGLIVALSYLFFFSSELPRARLIGLGFVFLGILALTPAIDIIIGFIPFVGDISPESEDYRNLLLERSWIVAQENLFFGAIKSYIYSHPAMQDLMQGQGIIDITNWYLQILLEFGLLTLLCLVLVQINTVWKLFRLGGYFSAMQRREYSSLCHIAAAVILLSSAVVATVSNIDRVANLHIIVLAIGQAIIYCLTKEKTVKRRGTAGGEVAVVDAPTEVTGHERS